MPDIVLIRESNERGVFGNASEPPLEIQIRAHAIFLAQKAKATVATNGFLDKPDSLNRRVIVGNQANPIAMGLRFYRIDLAFNVISPRFIRRHYDRNLGRDITHWGARLERAYSIWLAERKYSARSRKRNRHASPSIAL